MDFEWDEAKSDRNLEARGFDFAFAALIFEGPVLERIDNRQDYGEVRIQAIGGTESEVLFVVYTARNGKYRISARRADKAEREAWLSFKKL